MRLLIRQDEDEPWFMLYKYAIKERCFRKSPSKNDKSSSQKILLRASRQATW